MFRPLLKFISSLSLVLLLFFLCFCTSWALSLSSRCASARILNIICKYLTCICFGFFFSLNKFWPVICFVWSSVAQPNFLVGRWPIAKPNKWKYLRSNCIEWWNGIMACALNACKTHFDFGEEFFGFFFLVDNLDARALSTLQFLFSFYLYFFIHVPNHSQRLLIIWCAFLAHKTRIIVVHHV